MRNKTLLLVFVLPISAALLVALAGVPATTTTYYISSSSGSDSNDGTSPRTPWQTLSKLNGTTFATGDIINFKAGGSWNGNWTVRGNGTSARPITVQSYGTGPRPRFSNPRGHCIDVRGKSGWKFAGLAFYDSQQAIYLNYCTDMDKDYISIQDCFFKDIFKPFSPNNQDETECWGSAVYLDHDDAAKTLAGVRVRDVTIKHCIALNCGGLFFSAANRRLTGADRDLTENVTIDGCTSQGCPYNTMCIQNINHVRVKNCVLVHNGGSASISVGGVDVLFGLCADDVLEDTEIGWRGLYAGNPDGGGFDYEEDCHGSSCRNCDVHDCAGYGVMYYTLPQAGVDTKSNLFRNNGNRGTSGYQKATIHVTYDPSRGTVSGNTYYLLSGNTWTDYRGSNLTFSGNTQGSLSTVAMPAADYAAGTYSNRVTVTLSCGTAGARIYYTTDGSLPTTSSAQYGGPVTIARSTVLNAKAFKRGMERSYSLSNIYEITGGGGSSPAPTVSPPPHLTPARTPTRTSSSG
jgi:hypothetical protein